MFKSLADSLRKRFGRSDELSRQVQIVKIFDIYAKLVAARMGQTENIRPKSLKNKVLTVAVESSVTASELRIFEREIVEAINETLREEVVKKILYRF